MVDFEPTEEQKLMIETIHDFASSEIRENMREYEKEEDLDDEIRKKFAELGLHLLEFPSEVGGQNLSFLDRVLLSEELAWGDPGVARALMNLLPAAYFIQYFATAEQAKNILPSLSISEKGGIATALYEELSHADPLQFKTRAKKSGKKFIISGKKVLVDFANNSKYVLIGAMEEGSSGWEGLRFFLVENDERVKKVSKTDKLGLRATPTYTVEFENLEVEEDSLLRGAEDLKKTYNLAISKWNLLLASLSVGASRAAFEYSAKYSKERNAFGQPISQFQAISFMVADMATLIDSSRLLLWKAAREIDKGNADSIDVPLALLQTMEAGFLATSSSVQILGGHGYIQDHPVEKWMRDVRTISNYIGQPFTFINSAGEEIIKSGGQK